MSRRHVGTSERDRGTALILALVFLLVVSVVILALSNFAVEAGTNTTNLRTQRSIETAAENAATAAMQNVRTNYGATNYETVSSGVVVPPTPKSCLPSGLSPSLVTPYGTDSSALVAWCMGYPYPSSIPTRVVDIFVCGGSVSGSACVANGNSSTILQAEVGINDLVAGSSSTTCPTTSPTQCGLSASITTWDIRASDS
jgi:hypothetical protein